MKKAFTLLELIISVVLFFIIIFFLYETLNVSRKSNDFFSLKVNNIVEKNKIKQIFIEDFAESFQDVKISYDKNDNTIVQLQSSNTYHDFFYKNITYLLTKERNLVRIESLKEFDKENLTDEFFSKAYVDVLMPNINIFEVSKAKNGDKQFFISIYNDNFDILLFVAYKI